MDTQEPARKTRIIYSYGKMREVPYEGVIVRKKKTKKDILAELLDQQVDVLEFHPEKNNLDVQSREILQNLHQYFEAEKEARDVLLPTRSASERCSLATNVANRTYRHIVAKERRRKAAAAGAKLCGKHNTGRKRAEKDEDEDEEGESDFDDDEDEASSTSSIDLPPDQRIDFEPKKGERRPEERVEVRLTRSRSKSPQKSILKKRTSECE